MGNTDERKRIRMKKRKELLEEHRNSLNAGDTEGKNPVEPLDVRDEKHFEQLLEEFDTVLVDCYADWCGPCQMMEPTLDTVAANTDATVAKINVDEHRQLAQQLGVQGVPTLVLFVDGEPQQRVVGMQSEDQLVALIHNYTS